MLFLGQTARGHTSNVFRRWGDKDYYAILQVDPRAEPEVIEAAYRRLSRKYHPDVSGRRDAGERMRELNEAYDVLSDPSRRATYDLRRSVGVSSGPAGNPVAIQYLLRRVVPYLAFAIVATLAIRFLPLLVRSPILLLAVAAALVYLFMYLRRPGRH